MISAHSILAHTPSASMSHFRDVDRAAHLSSAPPLPYEPARKCLKASSLHYSLAWTSRRRCAAKPMDCCQGCGGAR